MDKIIIELEDIDKDVCRVTMTPDVRGKELKSTTLAEGLAQEFVTEIVDHLQTDEAENLDGEMEMVVFG